MSTIEEANRLFESGEPDEAAAICNGILNDDPDHPLALFILGRCFIAAARFGLAVSLYRKLVQDHPQESAYWNNLGHALHTISRFEEAEQCFLKAVSLDPANWHPYNNMTALCAATGRPQEALEWGAKAQWFGNAEERRDNEKNLALPLLGLGQWDRGWKAFDANLGDKWRLDKVYGQEGYWDGTPGQTVVFHGEQGIGDEVLFASMLPDAISDTRAIIDCDKRLEGLFRRSFAQATVYGTRHAGVERVSSAEHVEARCAFGSLGKFYRNRSADFPREPYLIPCPERRAMYRGALDRLPGKKIGIAWTGGTKLTRTDHRSLSVEQVEQFVSAHPGHTFISLEYKGDAIPKGVKHWPWATRTQDYDDTAALVAELDCVISVTTAVALLAGAIGTECHVMVPPEPTWHWGYDGDMPWLPLKLYRGDLAGSLKQIGEAVGV